MNKPNNGGTKAGTPPPPKTASEIKQQLADKTKAANIGQVVNK